MIVIYVLIGLVIFLLIANVWGSIIRKGLLRGRYKGKP